MSDPKPIVLTQAATNPSTVGDPQPMVFVGTIPDAGVDQTAIDLANLIFSNVAGYDGAATQYLENVSGTLTWVTVV